VELDVGAQLMKRYGKLRFLHQPGEWLGKGVSGAARREVDIDMGVRVVRRNEERETLQVIHVAMADEQIHSADALAFQLQAKLTDPGARIQHDETRAAADLDAGGVAAATDSRLTGAGDRASGSPELNKK